MPIDVLDDGAWSSSSESDPNSESESESKSEADSEAEPELDETVSDKARAGDLDFDFSRDVKSNLGLERGRVAGAAILSFSTFMLRMTGSIGVPGDFTPAVFF